LDYAGKFNLLYRTIELWTGSIHAKAYSPYQDNYSNITIQIVQIAIQMLQTSHLYQFFNKIEDYTASW